MTRKKIMTNSTAAGRPLNPAEVYATAKALAQGLAEVLPRLQKNAEAYADQVGADRLRAGDTTVALTTRKPSIRITDPNGMLDWVRDELPHLICETIPEASARWLRDKRLAVSPDGELVIDQVTGEILPWAEVTPGSRYLTVRCTEQVKAAAVAVAEQLVSQIPSVAGVLTPAALLEEVQA